MSSQNDALPEEFRRVAVLPLYGSGDETRQSMQEVILIELANTKRFEAVHVTREQLKAWTGRDQWSTADVLPQTLLARVREQLHCDGVMLPELTVYQAYPPLRLGWRITLVEAEAGRAIWAADEVFDATDPAVVNGARRFYTGYRTVHNAAPDSRFILLSPTAFGHYTAHTLFEALPLPQAAKFLPAPADKPIVVRSAS